MSLAAVIDRPKPAPSSESAKADETRSQAWRQWIGAACVTLAALAIRLALISHQSFSMDEISELAIAHGDLESIVWEPDGFPPLYHVLLHGWLKLWGSDSAARWLSAILGAATVPFVWLIGQQVGGFRTALASSLLLALLPIHVYYCQEARAYPLYALLAAATLCYFFRAMDGDRRRDWAWYLLASTLGMYCHYYFASVIVLAGLLLLVERRAWPRLRRGLTANVLVVIASLPLLWLLKSDLDLQTDYFAKAWFGLREFAFTYLSMFTGFTLGPSLREMHLMSTSQIVRGLLPWAATLGASIAFLGCAGLATMPSARWRVRLMLLTLGSVLLLGVIGNLANVGYIVRYSSWVVIPVVVILGQGLAMARQRQFAIACGVILTVGFAAAFYNHHFRDAYATEDCRRLAEYLSASPDRKLPVFVSSGYMVHAVAYYLGDAWAPVQLPNKIDDDAALKTARELIAHHAPAGQPFWLVYTREFHGDPRGIFFEAARARYEIGQPQARFAGIALYRGQAAH
ncbi:MAG: glycosyltransferase family 39 protein [Pirellulales bacterium]|nr:glycosyltransferase family 39 protein [Pirellulales bacterium]